MDRKKKILLVEDEVFIRDIYSDALAGEYEVITAEDGEQAMEMVQQKPDLIILDLMLPKKSGMDVLRELKADPNLKEIPVVALTNLGQSNVIEKVLNLGAVGYLLKIKISPTELPGKIKEFLSQATIH